MAHGFKSGGRQAGTANLMSGAEKSMNRAAQDAFLGRHLPGGMLVLSIEDAEFVSALVALKRAVERLDERARRGMFPTLQLLDEAPDRLAIIGDTLQAIATLALKRGRA